MPEVGGEGVIPVLRVADVDVTVAWYARLGFTEAWRHQFEPGLPRFVALRRGTHELFASEHAGDAPPGSLVWLRVGDLADLVAEVGGVPVEQPWGPELQLVDPDGNRLRVGPAAP